MEIICKYCRPHQSFPDAAVLNEHQNKEHVNKCSLCFIDLGSAFTFLNHYGAEHKDVCPKCGAMIGEDRLGRDEHIRQVHGSHPCSTCLSCYMAEEGLKLHYANPEGRHPFRCNKCKKELHNNRDFWMHCYEQHRQKCPLCDSVIKVGSNDKAQWEEHLRTAHRLLPCTECYEVFPDELEKQHHYNDKHRVSCTICRDSFPDEASREKHVNVAHSVKCSVCNELFPTDLQFQHHYNQMHVIACDKCPRTFAEEESKNNHYDAAHRVQCVLCGEHVAREMVDAHMRAAHRFPCGICTMVLDSEADRDRHATVVHLVPCEVCGLRLDSVQLKEAHREAAHRLPCDLCEKVCGTVQELQLHCVNMHRNTCGEEETELWIDMDTATQEQIHTCSVCSRVFSNEEKLVQHYRQQHVNPSLNCEFDGEEELMAQQAIAQLKI